MKFEYLIVDESDKTIKRCGKEILYLSKGDVIWAKDACYIVDNKHLDYDEKKFTVYVALQD